MNYYMWFVGYLKYIGIMYNISPNTMVHLKVHLVPVGQDTHRYLKQIPKDTKLCMCRL